MVLLAGALSCIPGQEDEALRVFTTTAGDRIAGGKLPDFAIAWTEANITRMLRRAGRNDEAEEREDKFV